MAGPFWLYGRSRPKLHFRPSGPFAHFGHIRTPGQGLKKAAAPMPTGTAAAPYRRPKTLKTKQVVEQAEIASGTAVSALVAVTLQTPPAGPAGAGLAGRAAVATIAAV